MCRVTVQVDLILLPYDKAAVIVFVGITGNEDLFVKHLYMKGAH